jgi:hypothetical protein
MVVPPGNRPALPRDWFRGVPERYVAGADTRGRPEGRPYPGSQQAIPETSGLDTSNGLCQSSADSERLCAALGARQYNDSE